MASVTGSELSATVLTVRRLLVVEYNFGCARVVTAIFCVVILWLASTWPALIVPRKSLVQVCWHWFCGMAQSWLMLFQLLTAWRMSHSDVFLSYFIFWPVSSSKKIQFEQKFCVMCHAVLFIDWHCVNMFGIWIHGREKFFVCLLLWRYKYEGRRLLVAPRPMVFTHHYTSTLRAEGRSLFFHFDVAEHFVFTFLSFSHLH